jgi:hypothetical protein
MNEYTYTIDEDDAVRIFMNGQDVPMILQPSWPDGTAWGDAEEAAEWAQTYISSLTDPDYEFIVGMSPEEPKRPKPEPPVLPEVPAAE